MTATWCIPGASLPSSSMWVTCYTHKEEGGTQGNRQRQGHQSVHGLSPTKAGDGQRSTATALSKQVPEFLTHTHTHTLTCCCWPSNHAAADCCPAAASCSCTLCGPPAPAVACIRGCLALPVPGPSAASVAASVAGSSAAGRFLLLLPVTAPSVSTCIASVPTALQLLSAACCRDRTRVLPMC